MEDWYLVTVESNRTFNIFSLAQIPKVLNVYMIGADLMTDETTGKVVYFGAPEQFLGKISVFYSIFVCSN